LNSAPSEQPHTGRADPGPPLPPNDTPTGDAPMTTQPDRVQQLAREANSYLKRDTVRDILLPADRAPQWFTELCHVAHGSMMPDDWRYEFIQDAVGAIADGSGEDRIDLDGLYPYTADRLAWLASHLDRPGYCDEAAADMGGPPGDILALVALGMDAELTEVFELVRARLEDMADKQEDAE